MGPLELWLRCISSLPSLLWVALAPTQRSLWHGTGGLWLGFGIRWASQSGFIAPWGFIAFAAPDSPLGTSPPLAT